MTIFLTILATLAAVVFLRELFTHLNPKDTPMITPDEQAALDAVKALVAQAAGADAALAAANQVAADAQAALAAEQANHAELLSDLQTALVPSAA